MTREPASTHRPVLDVRGVSVTFATESGSVHGVGPVDLSIDPGEVLALVGESGSGKSTVAFASAGLLPGNASVSGSIVLDGTQVVGATERELRPLRGSTAGFVFQEPATALNPLMRVGDQIAEAIRNHADASPAASRARAIELMQRVGIPDPARRSRAFPFELSGGQRQRVVIAMAIANRPALLIADEPTTALDVTVQAEILELIRALARDSGAGVLIVTHNMGVVADVADRVAVMHDGRVVETGTVEEVLLRPADPYTRGLLAAVPRLRTEPGARRPARSAASTPVIELAGIDVRYGRGAAAVRALSGFSVTVSAGETVGLVGESGSGKSTAARVALGLLRPTAGTVRLFGTDATRLRGRARTALRSDIGVVLQDPVSSLDSRLTVEQCIAEPMRVHRGRVADPRRRVRELLDAVRLPQTVLSRSPLELSGGQRQRVSLARALSLGPRLLVADEPTSALDVSVQQSVLDIIAETQSRLGYALLFVSHDLAVVQQICDRVVVMRHGRVEEFGTVDETLVSPRSAYAQALLRAVPVPDPIAQRERRRAAAEQADAAR